MDDDALATGSGIECLVIGCGLKADVSDVDNVVTGVAKSFRRSR